MVHQNYVSGQFTSRGLPALCPYCTRRVRNNGSVASTARYGAVDHAIRFALISARSGARCDSIKAVRPFRDLSTEVFHSAECQGIHVGHAPTRISWNGKVPAIRDANHSAPDLQETINQSSHFDSF